MIDERAAHPATAAANPFLIEPTRGSPTTVTAREEVAAFIEKREPDLQGGSAAD